MPRTKVKLAFIENDDRRNISFNRRAIGLVKSAQELGVLCGIDCCLIVNNPSGGQPVVWPSVPPEMERVLSKYTSLPEFMKDQHRSNQEIFLRQMVDKVQRKRCRLMLENHQKQISHLVCQCLVGREKIDQFSMTDLVDMSRFIEAKLKDVDARLKFLSDHPPPEPTQGNGKEVIVIPDTPDQNEMTLAEPSDLGKGKEVMNVLPFDLNMVKTEKDDPDIAGTWWEDPFQLPFRISKSDGAGPSSHP